MSEETEVVKGQDKLQLTFDQSTIDQHVFVAVFFHTYNDLFESSDKVAHVLSIYPPPLIVKEIFKLDETYLI